LITKGKRLGEHEGKKERLRVGWKANRQSGHQVATLPVRWQG